MVEGLYQSSAFSVSTGKPDGSLLSRRHGSALGLLQLIFLARVVAQFAQSRWAVSWLPTFDAFQSGALSYRSLAAGQLVIIAVQVWVVAGVVLQRRILSAPVRSIVAAFGLVYFLTMLARLVIGATVARGHSWLDKPLPSTFHLVLAAFVGVWVHYSIGMENA